MRISIVNKADGSVAHLLADSVFLAYYGDLRYSAPPFHRSLAGIDSRAVLDVNELRLPRF
jgi:hypothetical protein